MPIYGYGRDVNIFSRSSIAWEQSLAAVFLQLICNRSDPIGPLTMRSAELTYRIPAAEKFLDSVKPAFTSSAISETAMGRLVLKTV